MALSGYNAFKLTNYSACNSYHKCKYYTVTIHAISKFAKSSMLQ